MLKQRLRCELPPNKRLQLTACGVQDRSNFTGNLVQRAFGVN
jgi:hypothetical protein